MKKLNMNKFKKCEDKDSLDRIMRSCLSDIEKEELNTEINEATILEVRILKQIRENKERDFYKQQLLDLGVDDKRMENSLK